MAQPAMCSATILRLIGCGPVSSETGATSSQLPVAAESLGRRKAKSRAADGREDAQPSGRNLRNERRDVSRSCLFTFTRLTAKARFLPLLDSSSFQQQGFFPTVAIGEADWAE